MPPPLVGVAVNVTDVPLQIELPGLAAILTEGVTLVVTVIVILELVAVAGDAHAALLVITQLTISPFTSAAFVYVVLFAPTLLPFNFHWKAGVVPPLVGVAVKVTDVPVQIVLPGLAPMLMPGVIVGVTVIVTAPLVAVVGDAHDALLVITQVTTSPFARAALV